MLFRSLSGMATASTSADSSGSFTFSGLANGGYTVTPTSSTATFAPTSQNVTLSGTNSSVAFTATATSNMIFYDDLLGTTLDPTWVAMNRHGDYSNGEQQCYLPANVTVFAFARH